VVPTPAGYSNPHRVRPEALEQVKIVYEVGNAKAYADLKHAINKHAAERRPAENNVKMYGKT
jgi:hypothetical protein